MVDVKVYVKIDYIIYGLQFYVYICVGCLNTHIYNTCTCKLENYDIINGNIILL